ncbi:histidine phosphatase superfamily [Piptocephalis cylindrospora]|uniref:Histidine phosphatase superfamily n=1 Tax=Piptocephalis cylindrospora TaxID=1907219 RepID=A0A4P9XZG5_9FUNG|nr:histidine phosphatase superfamily [Piptocephalis cylindrospora]|eukprot:RKP11835.1 histidine phosphatase superfamily [Piptocephalis cylindrospora]
MQSSLWSLLVLVSAVQASTLLPHTPLVAPLPSRSSSTPSDAQVNATDVTVNATANVTDATVNATIHVIDSTVNYTSPLLSKDYSYCQAPIPSADSYTPLPNATLHQLQEVFRHGDRTPIRVLQGDSGIWDCGESREVQHVAGSKGNSVTESIVLDYTTPSSSPYSKNMWRGSCIPGQLTPKGIQQHHELGQALRSIYVDKLAFLPSTLDPSVMYLRTTDRWRTRQSLSSQLTGLYPPEHRASSDNTTTTAPLTVHVRPRVLDTLVDPHEQCPRVEEFEVNRTKTTEFQAYWNQTSTLRTHLNSIASFTSSSTDHKYGPSLVPFMDVVNARVCHAKPLPCDSKDKSNCVTKDQARQLLEAGTREKLLFHRTLPKAREINDLTIGPFLRETRDLLLDVTQGRPVPKANLYSAHDSTLLFLLAALESTDRSWPPYASSLIVELWKKDNATGSQEDWLGRLLYNGAPLEASWCDFAVGCPLPTYTAHLTKHIPKNQQASCESQVA